MPRKRHERDKQKLQQEDEHSKGEEMSDAMSLAEKTGAHAEQRISGAEVNVNELLTKVSTLENTLKTLTDKVDLECRSRRNDVRLVGLPEKAEGQDAAEFLERWLPGAMGVEPRKAPVIERAHRIGILPPNSSTGRVVQGLS